MKGAKIQVYGLAAIKKKLGEIPRHVAEEVDGAMAVAANDFVNRAQDDAPLDQGELRNLITYSRESEMNYKVVSSAEWSAYVEWGTRTRVQIPSDLTGYASKFKGKGTGDYYDFLNNILDWVKRKGLSNVTNSYTGKKVGGKAAKENLIVLAEAIAWSILKKGVHPHPFFFKQRAVVYKQLRADLKEVIKEALK